MIKLWGSSTPLSRGLFAGVVCSRQSVANATDLLQGIYGADLLSYLEYHSGYCLNFGLSGSHKFRGSGPPSPLNAEHHG